MLLRELVARPGLGLRVLHAPARTLDRPVRWVYTTDLIDPGRYLSGGELVITGMVWRTDAHDSDRFVAAVAAAGAAAIVAGETVFGEVPADVIDACMRHGLPLIAVPEETSFAQITEIVVGELTAARGERLAHTLGRQRQLLAAVAGGVELHDLAAQVSASIGVVCRVLSATGRAVAGPPLPPRDRDAVLHTFLTAARLPAVADGRHSVFPVGPASEPRVTSWCVAVDGAWPEWEGETGDSVAELVAITALDRARRGEGLRVAARIADDAVALVADGEGARPETAVRLRQAGLDADGPWTVVVARLTGPTAGTDPAETARTLLLDAATHAGEPVVGVHVGTAVALLSQDAAPAVVEALGRLTPGLGTSRLAVGVSRPSEPGALSGALRQAMHAATLAAARSEPVATVAADELTSHVSLLAGIPDEVRCAFAARVLEPVLDHDARTGACLLETLEVFLAESGSWSRTGERLHLHVNTVRYRIGRIEELTGRDLSGFTDRVDLFLALRSR